MGSRQTSCAAAPKWAKPFAVFVVCDLMRDRERDKREAERDATWREILNRVSGRNNDDTCSSRMASLREQIEALQKNDSWVGERGEEYLACEDVLRILDTHEKQQREEVAPLIAEARGLASRWTRLCGYVISDADAVFLIRLADALERAMGAETREGGK